MLLERLNIALEAVGLRNIEMNEKVKIDFEYKQQAEYLHELLDKIRERKKYLSLINKAKELATTDEQKQKLKVDENTILTEELFNTDSGGDTRAHNPVIVGLMANDTILESQSVPGNLVNHDS